jgi:tetratricopeptide (TPR) repeat protein
VDRVTRSKLKTDRFAVEVEHSVEFVSEHRKQVFQYGAAAVALVLVAAGIWYYRDRQHTARQEELAAAMDIMQAPVAPTGPPGQVFYTTDALKNAAAVKAFKPIYDKYSGTDEGAVAASYLGAISMDEGKLTEAEKYFQRAADSGDKNLASMAKLSLAQVYLSAGRQADAEKLLRSVYDGKPTAFVSKEQAAIALARAISTTKPAEARKLLEPLRTERPAVSQAAITLLSQLPPQ